MLSCPFCGVGEMLTYRRFVGHLAIIHSNQKNFRITCNLRNDRGTCCVIFQSVCSYKTHLIKFHGSTWACSSSQDSNILHELKCSVCDTVQNSLRNMAVHFKSHCDNDELVQCLVKHCYAQFKVYSSYTSHMSRLHRNVSYLDLKSALRQEQVVYTENSNSRLMEVDEESDVVDSIDFPLATRNIALLFMKMKTQYCLADSTVQALIYDFAQVFDVSGALQISQLQAVCSKYTLPTDTVSEIYSTVNESWWKRSVAELSTDFKRNSYYKEHFPYVPPEVYRYTDDCSKTETFQYVSLIEMLKVLLVNEDVRKQLTNPLPGSRGNLTSFRDGLLYKSHPIFSKSGLTLELILYSDEFEVVNPLGPHKKKHKIMAFYFTIGNLLGTSKSQKCAMYLLALCKSKDIQQFGLSKIAAVINRDVLSLEIDGLQVDGYGDCIRGAIAFIAGDNLNSHMIGGFNGSFSPNVQHPCRFCMVTNLELQTVHEADTLKLRTRESYDKQALAVSRDERLATDFGIRHSSVFISGSFHVVNGLPPDIMHDLLEGVVPFELALTLRALIKDGILNVEELNRILSSWNYGPLDKANQPVAISSNFTDTIKQNAGRMWCLIRLLPLMIGSKIPCKNVHWQFLLGLKDIVESAFAPELAVGQVIHLQMKIQDHISSFCELFPERRLKPKQHFLLHYAQNFHIFGPLRLCWCMRFEAKHSYFTRIMRVVNNYKNTCSTLAQRHQMYVAYLLASGSMFIKHEISFSSAVDIDINYLSDSVIDLIKMNKFIRAKALHQCKFVRVDGIQYHTGMYVVVKIDCDDSPVFGRIDFIFIQEQKYLLLLKLCKSEFNSHLSAHAVESSEELAACVVDDLLDYYPLTGYNVGVKRYVVLKNLVYDKLSFTY